MYSRTLLTGSLYAVFDGPALRRLTHLKPAAHERVVLDWAQVAVLRTRVVDQTVQTPEGGYSKISLGALSAVMHAAMGCLLKEMWVVGYLGLAGEARWRPTAVIGSTGVIEAGCRADGIGQAWAVGTIQPTDVVVYDAQADGVGDAYVELEPLPGECRAHGLGQAWAVGYVRSFAQADGEGGAEVSSVIVRIMGAVANGMGEAMAESTQVRQATARADGYAGAHVTVGLGLPLTCIVNDGALPGPSPASPRNYAR